MPQQRPFISYAPYLEIDHPSGADIPDANRQLLYPHDADNDWYVMNSAGVTRRLNTSGGGAVEGFTTTATAAGTTTLTNASTPIQEFTGVTTQDVVLPDATTLLVGWKFVIRNASTGAVTVKTNGGATLLTLAANQEVTLYLKTKAVAAGTWSQEVVSGSGARVLAVSPTLTTPTVAILGPASDSTTAVRITKADKATAVLTVDTTNGRLGINSTPSFPIHSVGDDGSGSMAQLGTAYAGVAQFRMVNTQAAATTNYVGFEQRLMTSAAERAAASIRSRFTVTNDATRTSEVQIYTNEAGAFAVNTYFQGTRVGVGVSSPTARMHLPAGVAAASGAPLKFTSGVVLATPEAGAVEFVTDDLTLVITTGAARKGIVLDDGTRLTSGKIPVASTNGRLIDGQTPLAGTKVYFVSDSSGGAVTRQLTFTNGILTAET